MSARKEPNLNADVISRGPEHGETFDVSEERWDDTQGITFLKLADWRGWVFDFKPGFGRICERVEARNIAPNIRVEITGLQSDTQFNGQHGSCLEWIASTGRWEIRLDNGQIVRLKPENLLKAFDVDIDDLIEKKQVSCECFALKWNGEFGPDCRDSAYCATDAGTCADGQPSGTEPEQPMQ